MPSLFEARTPPDDFCNCVTRRAGNQTRALCPRRDGGLDLLPFLTHHAALASGDARRAARRPSPMTPVLVPPACAGLPSRDASEDAPPPRACALRSIVRIDVHGSKDRAKDASRGACDDVSCLRPVPALGERGPTAFPSSAPFGHPLSSARSFAAEEAAAPEIEPT
jgi:hypothetical protein